MIIEIRRAGFVNKGAELMLHAVVQQLSKRYPDAKLTMAPIYGGADDTFDRMKALNLYPKAWMWRHGINFEKFTYFMPRRLLKLYGLISTKDIDVIIDAAGFCYSDQWGVSTSKELALSSKKWKKDGKKIIMLPQAFGPFEDHKTIKYVKEWAKNADLIFPREIDSYRYLTDICGEQDKIKIYPDFTNLVEGTLPKNYDNSDKRIALIPNYRMIDKTEKHNADAYLPFMISCAKYLVSKNLKPFVLVHEGDDDRMLAESISKAAGGIPIIKESNPLHIKGILGSCDATIGSRFHGLVSSLSQGVPSLATGWSHKYIRLFEDYSFKDGMISVHDSEDVIFEKIDLITNPDSASRIRNELLQKSNQLKRISNDMWDLVFLEIDKKFK